MKLCNFGTLTLTVACVALSLAPVARAVPMPGNYVDDQRCDPVANTGLTHELGNVTVFPANEAFIVSVAPTNQTICVPNDGIANDWIVRIVNVSGIAWQDLFFVSDGGTTVGNADGVMFNPAIATAPPTDAFRIDGTLTVTGMNDNLLSESMASNEIFQPGEIWDFMVSNFNSPGFAPPQFNTIGFGFATPAPSPSNASILANPIPEPASLGLIGMVGVAMGMRRRAGHA
jgi:hypothetical protein